MFGGYDNKNMKYDTRYLNKFADIINMTDNTPDDHGKVVIKRYPCSSYGSHIFE